MRKQISYVSIALLMMLVASMFSVLPVSAFIYPNGSVDNKYELYGPHVDQLQFLMYGSTDAMWTAMDQGKIDLCDWPLTTTWRQTFSANPDVMVVDAGGEAGFYTIDFNEDPYRIVPKSTRYPYKNPVYTDPSPGYPKGIPPISSNVYFRLACVALFNRTLFNQVVGLAGTPIYTPVPSYMGSYIWSVPSVPPAPNYTKAEQLLAQGHIYKTSGGVRYWDYDNSGQTESPPQCEIDAAKIIMTWRQDTYRTQAGTQLYTELQNMGFTVDGKSVTGGQNYQQVMLDKNYHITTLGWIYIGPDPDYLYDLYHVTAFYDDPESSCSNTADLNDTILNQEAEGIKFALTPEAALTHTIAFQQRFWAIAAQIPLFSSARYGANSKYYTGGNDGVLKSPDDGENAYRRDGSNARREWYGFCNAAGVGSNNWFSEINCYPRDVLYGTGNMTLRYGWSSQDYPKHINPFYSEWYWDSMVLGAMYDTLGYRDPYDVATWKPYMVKNWTVGTWVDPISHTTKSKVQVTLRDDIFWSDGTPVTIADVIFSLVESTPLLVEKGNTPPWWWPTAELVKSMSIIDGYTVEILYDVGSFFALGWTLGGFYIVPKHIWEPLIRSGAPMNAFAPDPNFICTGPFRYLKLTQTSSLVMVANTPGSTVKTDRPGSTSITSPGCFIYDPILVDVHTKAPPELEYMHKFPYGTEVSMGAYVTNNMNAPLLMYTNITVTNLATTEEIYEEVPSSILPELTHQKLVWDWRIIHTALDWGYDTWLRVHGDPGGNWDYFYKHIVKYLYVRGHFYLTDSNGDMIPGTERYWTNAWIRISIWIRVQVPCTGKNHGTTNLESLEISWSTIPEDIGGSNWYEQAAWEQVYGTVLHPYTGYAYKKALPTPNFKVDLDDILAAAIAFGSYPGHAKWWSVADLNHDYKVDLADYLAIAIRFGWVG
jgi:ABC-type transport system substrate-binding protein